LLLDPLKLRSKTSGVLTMTYLEKEAFEINGSANKMDTSFWTILYIGSIFSANKLSITLHFHLVCFISERVFKLALGLTWQMGF